MVENAPRSQISPLDNLVARYQSDTVSIKEPLNGDGIANARSPKTIDSRRGAQKRDQDLRSMTTVSAKEMQDSLSRSDSTNRLYESMSMASSGLNRDNERLKQLMDSRAGQDLTSKQSVAEGVRASRDSDTTRAITQDMEHLLKAQNLSSSVALKTGATTNSILRGIHTFQRTVHTQYMANTLGLQHQQVYLAKSLVDLVGQVGEMMEGKLEAIKHNTAASEIRKRTIADVARETILRNVITQAGERLSAKFLDVFGPWVQENVLDPAKDIGAAYMESDALGASTVRRVRSRAEEARSRVSERKSKFTETLRGGTQEERRARYSEQMNNMSDRASSFANDARGQFQNVRERVSDKVRNRPGTKELFETSRQRIRDVYDNIKGRATGGRQSMSAFVNDTLSNLNSVQADVLQEQIVGALDKSRGYMKSRGEQLRDAARAFNKPDLTWPELEAIKKKVASQMTGAYESTALRGMYAQDNIRDKYNKILDDTQGFRDNAQSQFNRASENVSSRVRNTAESISAGIDPASFNRASMASFVADQYDKRAQQASSGFKSFKDSISEHLSKSAGIFSRDKLDSTLSGPMPTSGYVSDILTSIRDDARTHSDASLERQDKILEVLALIAESGGMGGGDGAEGGQKSGILSRLANIVGKPFKFVRGAAGLASRGYMAAARGGLAVGRGALGLALSPFRRRIKDPFTDVYRKDDVRFGYPLVTSRQLRKGLVFVDGEPVEHVADIDRPVMDPLTQTVLITQEDVEIGLVDVNGQDLGKRTTSAVGGIASIAGSAMRTGGRMFSNFFSSGNPLFGMYGQIFKSAASVIGAVTPALVKGFTGLLGVGAKAAGGIGKGLLSLAGPLLGTYKDMIGGVFGGVKGLFSSIFGGKKSVGIAKEDLQQVVGSKLEAIYDLLVKRLPKRVDGDTDGDGLREGSWRDYLKDTEEEQDEIDENRKTSRSLGGRLAGLASAGAGGIASLLGFSRKKDSEESGDDDDGDSGILGYLGATAAGGWLASKLGVAKSAAKGLAKKSGSVIKGGAKLAGKTFSKKIPLLGALAGAGFAIDRAIDGDWLGALGELSSGIASIVPVIGTAASFGIDGWLAYRDFTKGGPTSELTKARMEAYGFRNPGEDQIKTILMLEEDASKRLFGSGGPFTRSDVMSVAEKLGFDPSSSDDVGYVAGWMKNRFTRIFATYLRIVAEDGLKPSEADSWDESQISNVLSSFKSRIGPILELSMDFVPTPKGYKELTNQSFLSQNDPSKRFNNDGLVEERSRAEDLIDSEAEKVSRYREQLKRAGGKASSRPVSLSSFDHLGKALHDARFKAYGVTTSEQRDELIKSERRIVRWDKFKRYVRHNEPINEIALDRLAVSFRVNLKDKDQVTRFNNWAIGRFLPVLKAYVVAAGMFNRDYVSIITLDADEISKFVELFNQEVGRYGFSSDLTPYPKNYDTSSLDGMTGSASSNSATDQISQATTGYKARRNRTASATINASRSNTELMSYVSSSSNDNLIGYDQGSLGSLSAHYESGTRGSSAIGYDKTGGTSYGKYQIASKTGTFNAFLNFLEEQGGEGERIAKRLREAGTSNTGSKRGGVPEEWKQLVKEGKLTGYEHAFIKKTHYDPVMHNLPEDIREIIESSPTLKDVVWSTAVQHGALRATDIVMKSVTGSKDPGSIVRKIYSDRALRFGSSSPEVQDSVFARFGDEQSHALAMIRKETVEKEGPLKAPSRQSIDGTIAGKLSNKDVNDLQTSTAGKASNAAPASAQANASVKSIAPAARSMDSVFTMTPSIKPPNDQRGINRAVDEVKRQQDQRVAALNNMSAEELRQAVLDGQAGSVGELKDISSHLRSLVMLTENAYGRNGPMDTLTKTIQSSSEKPVVINPIINPQSGDSNQSGRNTSIDINVARTGTDTGY